MVGLVGLIILFIVMIIVLMEYLDVDDPLSTILFFTLTSIFSIFLVLFINSNLNINSVMSKYEQGEIRREYTIIDNDTVRVKWVKRK